MKQILHIFAKDARHFLPEILISLAITAAFVWLYPYQWLQPRENSPELVLLASCLTLLVPVSWWLLVSRVVHAENLVGDTQFWITRPYEWQNLLAAKLLFLACFLYLPILLAQSILLARAGFHPLAYLPGLLFNLLLISAVLVLPLLALAAVTSTFARMTLVIIGIFLCIIALSAISAVVDHAGISNPLPDHLSLPLVLCGCIVVVVLQYFQRRVVLARLLLVTLVILLWAAHALTFDSAAIQRAYPLAANGQSPSLQLSPLQDSSHQPSAYPTSSRKWVGITVPLAISNIAGDSAWISDNVKVSIEGPREFRWSSPWQSIGGYHTPDSQDFFASFTMSRAIFDQIRSAPVTLHLSFAWTELRSGQPQRIALPTQDFAVPGFGICSPAIDWTNSDINGIQCRHALRSPRLTYVQTHWSEQACPSDNGIPGSGWTGTLDTNPADFSLSTVGAMPLQISNAWELVPDRPNKPRHLCPGTTLTFTPYTLVRRTQSDVTIPNFRLPAYKGPSDTGAGSFGVMIAPR